MGDGARDQVSAGGSCLAARDGRSPLLNGSQSTDDVLMEYAHLPPCLFVAGSNPIAERPAGVFVAGPNLVADGRKLRPHLIAE